MARTRSPRVRRESPPTSAPSTIPGRARVALTLAAFAIVFIGLEVYSYTGTSATWDEPIHLADGYMSVSAGDFRVDPEHPPLLRMWAALPLLASVKLADPRPIDGANPTWWAFNGLFDFSHRFVYRDNDADGMLYPARFMIVLLGVLLGWVLFAWAYDWYGFAPAALSLVLFAAEPNLAAHAALVTTDFGVTFLMFTAVYCLYRTTKAPGIVNIASTTLVTCLALVSKFSALLLGPIMLVLLLIATFWTRQLKARVAVILVVLMAAGSVCAIWGVYGFRHAPSRSAGWLYKFHEESSIRARLPVLSAIVGWVDDHRLLPNLYTEGFLLGQAKAQTRKAFFAGDYSEDGWWLFFPAAFAIKTPIALIVVAGGGLFLYWRRWRGGRFGREWFVLLPIGLYGGWAMTAHINIGLRHILPIYPFVILLAVEGLDYLWTSRRRALLAGVLVTCAVEFFAVYPHNLAFFNALVGGPANGSKYLVDSNLDWGQDLKPLKRWMTDNHVPHVNLAYFGFADPRYYQIDCTFLPGSPPWVSPGLVSAPRLPGYVAVSATLLRGVYGENPQQRAFYAPLERQTPVASIGHSILVYWVERRWW
jgi:hypothetical protein